jgi:hypothetical protein
MDKYKCPLKCQKAIVAPNDWLVGEYGNMRDQSKKMAICQEESVTEIAVSWKKVDKSWG